MAGQSEAADDLIAELAKLMAQDAQGDRKAQPSPTSTTSTPFSPVRIPGEAGQKSAGSAPTDFLRSLSGAAVDTPKPAANRDPVALPTNPRQQTPAKDVGPAPFNFDFGFGAGSVPTTGLEDAPAVTATPVPPTDAPGADVTHVRPRDEHDSIADLISAELAADPAPRQDPEPMAPAPETRPAPSVMATSVAANTASLHGESLGAPRADQDRFRVPPVFGLGSTAPKTTAPAAIAPVPPQSEPEPVQPTLPEPAAILPRPAAPAVVATAPIASESVGLDPIDEIESLIGRAMRVEFDLPVDEVSVSEPIAAVETPRPAPSPALRSLATPTVPSGETASLSAADQTIFAAAQATGAKVGWVNDPDAEDAEPEVYDAAPRQRRSFGLGMSRAVAGPLVAVTLLLAAGFGLYWVLGLGSRDAGPAPLLTADTAPVKEAAPVVTPDESTSTQSVVFNEINGVAPSADEQLVSRDQSDVNEVTQVAIAPVDVSEEGLANRKVRTVKVRPDGTIVSGDDSVAGSAILPVDRPNVPAVPGAETATPDLLANIEPVAPAPAATVPVATLYPVQPGSTVPAVDLSGNLIAGKSAIVPLVRPIGLKLPVAALTTTDTQPTPAAVAPSLSVPGATEVQALGDTAPAYVQLASQRSEADARQSAQNMVTRYGPLFGGANLEVQRVDLGIKGIYYRVRVPANSMEQANMICTNVKAAGGDCFTL